MTDIAAIRDRLRELMAAADEYARSPSSANTAPGQRFAEGLAEAYEEALALLADTPSVEPGDADRLRDAIRFTAIPTLLVFAEGNAGVRKAIERLEAAVGPSSGKGRVTNRRLDQRLRENRYALPTQASDSPEKP